MTRLPIFRHDCLFLLINPQIDHFPHSNRYVPHTNDTFKQRYCKSI